MRTTMTPAGREHPCFEVRGAEDGPRVAVIAAVQADGLLMGVGG